MNVLVVDDIVANRYIIKEILKALGHKVVEAENGKVAVDKLQTEHFDLIFMDIEMPVMNGIETTKFIRVNMNPQKTKTIIVALTAYTPSVLQEDFDTSVFNEVITKPYTAEKIKNIIDKLIVN